VKTPLSFIFGPAGNNTGLSREFRLLVYLPACLFLPILLPGCASAPSSQAVVSAESQSPVFSADPSVGIVSHSHEEVEILPRAVLLASVPHTVQEEKEQTRPEQARPEQAMPEQARPVRTPVTVPKAAPLRHEVIFPEIDALSPFARLLALSGPASDSDFSHYPDRTAHTQGIAGLSTTPPTEWRDLAREAEEIFGLDAGLILAVIRAESAFDHRAESAAGAQGAMQVMPTTQEELGLIDPFDPRANVYAGTQYLTSLIRRFGAVELALAAYNAGPAQVEKYGGIPPFEETRQFVRRVMDYWRMNIRTVRRPE